MSDFILMTDNTADLYEGFYEESKIRRLEFSYSIQGKEYVKDEEYPLFDFYDALKEGNLVKTSQVNQYYAQEVLEEELQKGNDILYISFSSGMSGSYDNISYVVKGLKVKYPERRIEIVDSLCGAGGEGLIVYYANKLKNEGKSMDEIIKWIEENRTNVHHIFIVNDLVNLKHSGRISSLAALLGMIVNIKPILEITREGKVGVLAKSMGRKKAIAEIVRFFKAYYQAEKNDFILIGHTNLLDEAKQFGSKIQAVAGDKEIRYSYIDRLVAGNAGYSSLVVYFLGKERMTK